MPLHHISQGSGFVNCDICSVRYFSRKDLFVTFYEYLANATENDRTRIRGAIRYLY